MENTENWVEKYKERMDKNKPSEKLVEQTLELMKHQIELQRKDKKKMLKNRIKFTALTLVFAFLLSSCSTKKTGQEWNSYNENSEWSYFMPKDVDRDMVPFIFPGKYVADIEIETQNEFKTYIERYTELETCKLMFYDIGELFKRKWTVKEF